jgi:hypothetical protein
MWKRAAPVAFAVAACTTCAGRALAQTPSPTDAPEPPRQPDSVARARERYDGGTRAFGQGRFVEAALEFEAAAAEKPSAVALYTAALSWERAGVSDRAADDYARTVALSGLPAEQAAAARDRLAALERVLGTLSVTSPEGWRVQLDANTEVAAPATLHGAPGLHTLGVHPTDRPAEQSTVVLQAGVTTVLSLPVAGGSLAAQSAGASHEVDLRRGLGLVLVGAAGAALLAGGLLGVEALEARDAYDGAPTQATLDHASHLQTWTNVAFIAGGCVMAAGLALVLWPSPRASTGHAARPQPFVRVGLSPVAVVVEGTFSR